MEKIECATCKKMFKPRQSKNKVCSRECYAKRRSLIYKGENHPQWRGGISNLEKNCIACALPFRGPHTQLFCSNQCQLKSFSHSGSSNGMWRGGRKRDKNGYILVLQPTHPQARAGYVREHRLIVEAQIGRMLSGNEVVHHKNGKKDDNSVSNLVLLTKTEHDTLHRRQRAGFV